MTSLAPAFPARLQRALALPLLLTGLTLPAPAHAASTVELRVIGTIKPGACTPTLSGHIDYGTIANDSAQVDVVTSNAIMPTMTLAQARALAPRSVTLDITCTAAMPVAIVVRDNKAGSKVAGLAPKASVSATEASMFSLDASGSDHVGAFHLAMRSASAGGKAVDIISAPISALPNWTRNEAGIVATDRLLSWAPSGQLKPGAWTSISGTLEVTPVLKGGLDRTQDISMRGSATIEIRYL